MKITRNQILKRKIEFINLRSIVLYVILFTFIQNMFSCKSSEYINLERGKNCLRIDTLIKEQYFGQTNYYANRIIPILEKESGIYSNSEKGFIGYSYKNDTVFDNDIKKWKIYFKCK